MRTIVGTGWRLHDDVMDRRSGRAIKTRVRPSSSPTEFEKETVFDARKNRWNRVREITRARVGDDGVCKSQQNLLWGIKDQKQKRYGKRTRPVNFDGSNRG